MNQETQHTSVKVNTSWPTPLGLNLILRTPHPGAFADPLVQSHWFSKDQAEIPPGPARADPVPEPRVLSVWMTFKGLVLLTSQITTTPSWDATANLEPFAEKAVEKEAGTLVVWYMYGL